MGKNDQELLYKFTKIVKENNRVEYWVDGNKIIDAVDPENHNEGLFGFRTWHTSLWWDNLVIKRLD